MSEERKEMWTTQIRKGDDSGFNQRRERKITEVYDDISQYKPKYLPAGSMGYDSRTQLYTQTKPIKVRNSDGSFTVYDVPKFAVEGVYVPQAKSKVEPIANLVTQNPQDIITIQQQPVQPAVAAKVQKAQSTQVSTTTKPKHIVKQSVPQNLLPYIANVTSDGVAFFNIPDGYTNDQFQQAVQAVYGHNKELAQKPMVYYEQPQQQIQQQQQQQQATQQSQKQYQIQRQKNLKYITDHNVQTVKAPIKNISEPDLVAEVFAYPNRKVHVYNIHPEAYQKVLEYLNKNYNKSTINNKYNWYVLSPYGFNNVPIGGEVNDSIFHYFNKKGEDNYTYRWHFNNANLINKNEPHIDSEIYDDIVTNNGKIKLYSHNNDDQVYYKNRSGFLVKHPFKFVAYKDIDNIPVGVYDDFISDLREYGFSEQQIKDYINKFNNTLVDRYEYNGDKSIFHPIEKQQSTQNNSSQQVKQNNSSQQSNSTNNIVQKAKQKAKKVLSFLGFQNGGQLKYYKNGK